MKILKMFPKKLINAITRLGHINSINFYRNLQNKYGSLKIKFKNSNSFKKDYNITWLILCYI